MKKAVVFKTLIDVFYFLHILGFVSLVFKIPLELLSTENSETLQAWDWIFIIINIITFLIFLRGLFFLRKMARLFLQKKHLSDPLIGYMKSAGNHFIYSAIPIVLILIIFKIIDVDFKPLNLPIEMSPGILIIVGLFLVLQSNTLLQALKAQIENDMTI